jgi:hypothetical protein
LSLLIGRVCTCCVEFLFSCFLTYAGLGLELDHNISIFNLSARAKKYGILHKTREVTYRGVFIIDPDGILRFIATYPLEVGRNMKEVERIIRVLQRARELSQLTELDRARELSKYNE